MSTHDLLAENKVNSSEIWNNLAVWWDKDIGDDCDEFHHELIFPNMKSLLKLKVGDILLDIGCGNGGLIRHLYQDDITFLGVDYSENFIEAAKKRSEKFKSVFYQQCDVTDLRALQKLNTFKDKLVKYDVVVSTMVLHDIPTLDPLFEILPDLIKENGQFIFAIPSPHYYSVYNSVEVVNDELGVFTTGYGTATMKMGKARTKPDQPFAHCNFHRPLGSYINPLIKKGFVLTDIVEPVAISPKIVNSSDIWRMFSKIPQIIILSFINQPYKK